MNMKSNHETAVRTEGSLERLVGPPPRKVHTLKIWPQYIDPIGRREKTFEVRKCDRDFRVGDILHLREWFPDRNEWGARNITCFVTYIMHGPAFGIEEGYCVMGIAMPRNHNWHNTEVSGRRNADSIQTQERTPPFAGLNG